MTTTNYSAGTVISKEWLNDLDYLGYTVFADFMSDGAVGSDGTILVSNGTKYVEESGATARTSLGLAIGTDVQAWDDDLDDIAALTPTDGNIIVGDGTDWVAESGNTARTSLGLGTTDSPTFTGLTATGDVELTGTSHIKIPSGTTAQRPGTPTTSDLRWNTSLSCAEIYNGSAWVVVAPGIVLGTEIDATNGGANDQTVLTFSSIPSWAKKITVLLNGVSTNGTSPLCIQLGDSGGLENTGYSSSSFNISSQTDATAGFILNTASGAGVTYRGAYSVFLEDVSSFRWVGKGSISGAGSGNATSGSGVKALDAALDRIALTTIGGSDTFDAGTVNIQYEG